MQGIEAKHLPISIVHGVYIIGRMAQKRDKKKTDCVVILQQQSLQEGGAPSSGPTQKGQNKNFHPKCQIQPITTRTSAKKQHLEQQTVMQQLTKTISGPLLTFLNLPYFECSSWQIKRHFISVETNGCMFILMNAILIRHVNTWQYLKKEDISLY